MQRLNNKLKTIESIINTNIRGNGLNLTSLSKNELEILYHYHAKSIIKDYEHIEYTEGEVELILKKAGKLLK